MYKKEHKIKNITAACCDAVINTFSKILNTQCIYYNK